MAKLIWAREEEKRRMINYRLIGGAVCRQDVPGGDWVELTKDEANAVLATITGPTALQIDGNVFRRVPIPTHLPELEGGWAVLSLDLDGGWCCSRCDIKWAPGETPPMICAAAPAPQTDEAEAERLYDSLSGIEGDRGFEPHRDKDIARIAAALKAAAGADYIPPYQPDVSMPMMSGYAVDAWPTPVRGPDVVIDKKQIRTIPSGITTHEWFVGQALAGAMASIYGTGKIDGDKMVRECIAVAEAMMTGRVT